MGLTETLRLVIDGSSEGAQAALGQLKDVAKTTDKDLGGFGEGMNKAANAAAVGVAALTGVILKSAYDTEQRGTAIKELMRMTGDSVKEASTLTGQWQETGLSIEEGSVAMKKFSQNMSAVASGTAKTNPFEALGISVVDANGNLRDSATVLSEVREKMSGMQNATQRTDLAFKLFGKSGDDLLSWLTKTPAEIEAMNKQLAAAGLIWGPKEMKQYQDAAVAQRDLMVSLTGLEQMIAFEVVPTFTKMVEGVVWVTDRMGPLAKAIPYVTLALAGFVGVVKGVQLAQTVMGWVGALSAWITKSGVAAVAEGVETTAIGVQTAAIEANTVARAENALAGGGGVKIAGFRGLAAGEGAAMAGTGTAAAMGLGSIITAATIAAAPLVVGMYLTKNQDYVEGRTGAAGTSAQGRGAGGAFFGSSKGYGGGRTVGMKNIPDLTTYRQEKAALDELAKSMNGLKPSADTVGAIDRYLAQLEELRKKTTSPDIRTAIDKTIAKVKEQADAFEQASQAAKDAAEAFRTLYTTMADFFKATNLAAIMGTPLPTAAQAAFASQSDQAAAFAALQDKGYFAKQFAANQAAGVRNAAEAGFPAPPPSRPLPWRPEGFKLVKGKWVRAAAGVDFITQGTTPIIAGEAGPERVKITPLGRKGAGVTPAIHLHFHGPVVGGKAGLRELTDIMNRSLGPQVDRLQRGRFASA